MAKKKIAMSFSGKDSVLALHKLLKDDNYEVACLLITANDEYKRTGMHGVRIELLRTQADSIGIPLKIVFIPKDCSNEVYQSIMSTACKELLSTGINIVAFGDILLEDVRKYREEMLEKVGISAVFPLWGMSTNDVIDEFLELGYKTVLTCVDTTKLDENFAGKVLDRALIADFPDGVDICGENGEYHSFVFDGPVFNFPINYTVGEKRMVEDAYTKQMRFCFADINFVE